ncbi:MAG: hypothetical protein OEZ58_00230 [Gammaproteobacteria bacterium]|nr:hypothetical protein [Gammaproteobacteria bacterium]
MIDSFEKRMGSGFYLSIVPKPAAKYIVGAAVSVFLLFVVKGVFYSAVSSTAIIIFLLLTWNVWRNYGDWLVIRSKSNGNLLSRLKTFGPLYSAIFADHFGWKTALTRPYGDEKRATEVDFIVHHEGAVSLAFVWDGVSNHFFDEKLTGDEHDRRIFLLKKLADKHGLVIEHHLFRLPDTRLVDAYEAEGRKMYKDEKPPEIVSAVRQGIAEIGRKFGRSNRVMTVLSLGSKEMSPIFSVLFGSKLQRNRTHASYADELYKVFKLISSDYPGVQLLSKTDYMRSVQRIRDYASDPIELDWRMPINDQIITTKPAWDAESESYQLNGLYYKTCLVQSYPTLDYSMLLDLFASGIDLHICQIIKPKDTLAAMDKNFNQQKIENDSALEKKRVDWLASRFSDMANYRAYVNARKINVFDNAFLITLICPNREYIESLYSAFANLIGKNGGSLRHDQDLQLEMQRIRLPGLGRNSLFLREDHSDTLAVMMPFTTYPTGCKNPESLRVSSTGNLVGTSPSKVAVAHELIAAQTLGGKDTYFGHRFLETYKRIHYDIIELGNSQQGNVEAVGGHYCRAKEQMINPLMSYNDYDQALHTGAQVSAAIVADLLGSQMTILNPIFNGLKGNQFTRAEEVVISTALTQLYEHQVNGVVAPTLPMLLDAMNNMTVPRDIYQSNLDQLGEKLLTFLDTPVGSAFKEQDQFVISPVANAIDFDKFTGDVADYSLSFTCVRLCNRAFARAERSQLVLNEYKILLERSPEAIKWISLSVDRMGRKDWVGLTRISQGHKEIVSVDTETVSSIPNITLLSRNDQHDIIGNELGMPGRTIEVWKNFPRPSENSQLNYREAFVFENGVWHHLKLMFPDIGLRLMNTNGADKKIREHVFKETRDPMKRIAMIEQALNQRDLVEQQGQEDYKHEAII